MNKIINIPIFFIKYIVITLVILLIIQCDKFSQFDFLTPKDFILNAYAHNIDVKTKQEHIISDIKINGKPYYFSILIEPYKDSVYQFDGFSVAYYRQYIQEINGEWFHIAQNGCQTQITIDKNHENIERVLVIIIGGIKNFSGTITIVQKEK
ncbi:MAG: hypothetical protein LBC84_08995 [Prevotellaceae bacterium]|jgi:hypothetical protein|nr:hypothetical protein [Prevotellaceae bacterium]